MKKYIPTIFLTLIFLIGLSLLLYPTFSNWWNSFHQSRAILNYSSALTQLEDSDYSALFQAAEDYNEALARIDFPLMYYDRIEGYETTLNAGGNGIIGYVEIPKISVSLPIYHGTSESVLQIAVGHLEGTSFPIGEKNTHCVLSAHRGLPSAKLFTDLDKLELGDTFTLTVLDRKMQYEVDQILIVEPQDVEALYVQEGEDLCTLMTCTPYGINSHRLLVRGHRVEIGDAPKIRHVTADAVQLKPELVAAALAVPSFLLLLMIPKRRNRP